MKIVLLGSGNVATHLAKALRASGNEIVQVYSRTAAHAKMLTAQTGGEPVSALEDVYTSADLYIFSLKDDALPDVIRQMPQTEGVWVHTAGSIPATLFASRKEAYGVIYPLQTFSRDRTITMHDVPLFIEGSTPETTRFLLNLAVTLSAHVFPLSGERRRYLHLAAVFACNFTNHMYTLAAEILRKEQLPFDVLKPLITETAAKVMVMDPDKAQTGPAVRFDEGVMQRHLALIDEPLAKEIYSLISKSIHDVFTREQPDEQSPGWSPTRETD